MVVSESRGDGRPERRIQMRAHDIARVTTIVGHYYAVPNQPHGWYIECHDENKERGDQYIIDSQKGDFPFNIDTYCRPSHIDRLTRRLRKVFFNVQTIDIQHRQEW
jgi:hypothetical protein